MLSAARGTSHCAKATVHWTDPQQLAKQVKYLDRHPSDGVFSSIAVIYEDGVRAPVPAAQLAPRRERRALARNFIPTNSVGVLPSASYDIRPASCRWVVLVMRHAVVAKISYLLETMAVYRRHASRYLAFMH